MFAFSSWKPKPNKKMREQSHRWSNFARSLVSDGMSDDETEADFVARAARLDPFATSLWRQMSAALQKRYRQVTAEAGNSVDLRYPE